MICYNDTAVSVFSVIDKSKKRKRSDTQEAVKPAIKKRKEQPGKKRKKAGINKENEEPSGKKSKCKNDRKILGVII